MANEENLDVLMVDLDILNEENAELVFDEDFEEAVNRLELCLVGRFFNVRALQSKMADIGRPAIGVNIKSLSAGLFWFQFYHKDDMKWILSNRLWSFDNAMLVINVISAGEDPTKVSLNEIEFWIQIHNLPSGYMVESVGRQLGNFLAHFRHMI